MTTFESDDFSSELCDDLDLNRFGSASTLCSSLSKISLGLGFAELKNYNFGQLENKKLKI